MIEVVFCEVIEVWFIKFYVYLFCFIVEEWSDKLMKGVMIFVYLFFW